MVNRLEITIYIYYYNVEDVEEHCRLSTSPLDIYIINLIKWKDVEEHDGRLGISTSS